MFNGVKLNLHIMYYVYVAVIILALVFSIKFYEIYEMLLSGIQSELSIVHYVCM